MATRREGVRYEITATDQASQIFRQVERSAQGLHGAYSQLTGAVAGLVSAGALLGAVRAAQQAEQAHNRLNAVLRATGGAAGIASDEYGRLAESMAEMTQFDDDSIRSAQATLVKFGNIHGQVFRDALRLSGDLAAFLGTDIPDAAQMLGRSLQSPTEGLTLMERQFGKLTETEEGHIKALVEQGRAIEAQNAVLDLWQKKVGGVAAAMNTGLTRSLGEVSKQWRELLETLGKSGRILDGVLGGAAELLKDIRLHLEGTRSPIDNLAQSTLEWLSYLRFVPGALGEIGKAARNASIQATRQRVTGSGRIRDMELEDIQNLEAGLASFKPVELGGGAGGKSDREKELERLRQLAAKSAEEDLLAQERALEARDDLIRAEAQRARKERERLDALAQESGIEDLLAQQRRLEERDEQVRETRLRELRDRLEEAERASLRFDNAINAAFDRAARGAEDLGDVLKNLVQELALIELQKRFFEPLSKAFSKGLDELFKNTGSSGGEVTIQAEARASGGPVTGGMPYLIGEQGPELFVPAQSGYVVPNGAMPAITINQSLYVDGRSDQASIMQGMLLMKEQAKVEILQGLRRGGAAWRATRG